MIITEIWAALGYAVDVVWSKLQCQLNNSCSPGESTRDMARSEGQVWSQLQLKENVIQADLESCFKYVP